MKVDAKLMSFDTVHGGLRDLVELQFVGELRNVCTMNLSFRIERDKAADFTLGGNYSIELSKVD